MSFVQVCAARVNCLELVSIPEGMERLTCPAGFRFAQAYVAALARDSPTLRNARTAASLGICPLLSGSGKSGTPWERTHRAKATADGEFADPPAFGEPPGPVDDGLPPHA